MTDKLSEVAQAMPTTEDNPGTSRCEISSIGRGYEAGYDDGLQLSRSEGERRGWEMGKEAAAEWLENSGFMYERGTERHRVLLAGDVRKLKKP